MHLTAVFQQNCIFLRGSPAVFFVVFKKPPGLPGEVWEGFLGIPGACRNHLWVFFRVWPGVNFHFVKWHMRGWLVVNAKTAENLLFANLWRGLGLQNHLEPGVTVVL